MISPPPPSHCSYGHGVSYGWREIMHAPPQLQRTIAYTVSI